MQETPTLRLVLEKYMEVRGPKLRASSLKQYPLFVYRCFPDWLNKPVGDITRFDCEQRYAELCSIQTSRAVTGGRCQANNAFRVLQALITFSMAYWEYPNKNCVQQFRAIVKPQTSSPRQTHIPYDKIGQWYQLIQKLSPLERDMQIMWMLTGVRHRALINTKWSEVDLNDGVLTIPGEREKNKCVNRINLTPFLVRLLRKRLLLTEGSPYLFPSFQDPSKPCHSISRGYMQVARELGRHKDSTLIACNPHALRHTFATCARMAGLSQDDVAVLLNHIKMGVTGGYIHIPFETVRPTWTIAQNFIQDAMGVSNEKPRIVLGKQAS